MRRSRVASVGHDPNLAAPGEHSPSSRITRSCGKITSDLRPDALRRRASRLTRVTKHSCRRWPKLGSGSPTKRPVPKVCKPPQLQSRLQIGAIKSATLETDYLESNLPARPLKLRPRRRSYGCGGSPAGLGSARRSSGADSCARGCRGRPCLRKSHNGAARCFG